MTDLESGPRGAHPQVKVCGLTRVDEAQACAALGIDAVGLVFYPPSPRFVTEQRAREIADEIPASVATVGVFVDEPLDGILRKIERCRLRAVQLHGREPPELIDRLQREAVLVIKALFSRKSPGLARVADYTASAFLVECGSGRLPGGNAREWNWQEARAVGASRPLLLAGGLNPDNVADAIAAGLPDALDVSSGVERAPGRKDKTRVRRFMEAVAGCRLNFTPRRIF
jgi:phosphoribosylanthranilate isomerase/indole-3-glycerol phosphate synthase/phosphoribosylanthranilate isomerase